MEKDKELKALVDETVKFILANRGNYAISDDDMEKLMLAMVKGVYVSGEEKNAKEVLSRLKKHETQN